MLKNKRVALCGRNLDDLRPLLDSNLILVEDDPEFVISYGGDGALLGAERQYPGVPKIPIRDSRLNPKCESHREEDHLKLAMNGQLNSQCVSKLTAWDDNGNSLSAVNDVILHNSDPRSAVRYRVWVDDQPIAHQIVGDGIVVATPFGSTAYYRSITHSTFNIGIGVAFNNSTEPLDHMVLSDNCTIKIQVTRGPAVLFVDNDPAQFEVQEGEFVYVKRSLVSACFYGLDIFRCKSCYHLRQEFWRQKWI